MGKGRGKPDFSLAVGLHTLAFGLGATAGVLLAAWLTERGALTLEWLLPGFSRGLDAVRPSFSTLLWDVARWPLMAWLLGFTALGGWMLPLLFAVRGFALGYCVAGLTAALQAGGLLLSVVVFGLAGLITVPVFFGLGIQSFLAARQIRGRVFASFLDSSLYPPSFWFKTLLGLGSVFLCAFVEFSLFPSLLQTLVSNIS